ncbi:hypothetical protein [Streptosporangium sandarakinum]
MRAEEPTEAPDVAVSEPEPNRWTPVEAPAPPTEPEPERREEPAEERREVGTPAGQLALGAASAVTVAGLGLYQVAGVVGLAATGGVAVAGAGGYGYWRWRRAHPRRGGRSERGSRSGGRATRSFDLGLGKSRGGVGRRMTFGGPSSSGRSSRSRIPGAGRAGGGTAGRRVPLGGPAASSRRGAFRPGAAPKDRKASSARTRPTCRAAAQTAAHAVSAPLRAAGRATRVAGQRAAQAGRVARAYAAHRVHRARAASRRLDDGVAQLAGRAGHRARRGTATVARQVRRAAGWADRRTGQRASTAWAAALTGGRRAAVQALRSRWRAWDAHAVAALAALAAWVSAPVRRRLAAHKAAETPATEPTAAAETPAATPEPIRSLPVRSPLLAPARRYYPMSAGSPLIAASADMIGSVSRYLPMDMWEVARDFEKLHQVPENVARAIGVYLKNLETAYPIDPRVTQMLGEFYQAMAAPSAMAQQISAGFNKIHAEDIKRRDAPRTGEHLWNV